MKTKTTIFDSLTCVSDIIFTMLKGLENEWVKINMNTYGGASYEMCYGCAATNTLCEIMQKPFSAEYICDRYKRLEFTKTNTEFRDLERFEYAIDYLRMGQFRSFLMELNSVSNLPFNVGKNFIELLSIYEESDITLPYLGSFFTKEELEVYRNFAKLLKFKKL